MSQVGRQYLPQGTVETQPGYYIPVTPAISEFLALGLAHNVPSA